MIIKLITDIKDYPKTYGAVAGRNFFVIDTLKGGKIVMVFGENDKPMWINETEFKIVSP